MVIRNIYHITWATYNSRVSQRMIDYEAVIKLRREEKHLPQIISPRLLNNEEEIFIAKSIKGICQKNNYKILAINICIDHIHLATICEDKDISNLVKTIKSISSRELNIFYGYSVKETDNVSNLQNIRDDSHISSTRGITQTRLWQAKFCSSIIKDEEELFNVINYINNNRSKHGLFENNKLKEILNSIDIKSA